MTDDIGLALVIRSVTENSLASDNALLALCEKLVEKVTDMQAQINELTDRLYKTSDRLQDHIETGE